MNREKMKELAIILKYSENNVIGDNLIEWIDTYTQEKGVGIIFTKDEIDVLEQSLNIAIGKILPWGSDWLNWSQTNRDLHKKLQKLRELEGETELTNNEK